LESEVEVRKRKASCCEDTACCEDFLLSKWQQPLPYQTAAIACQTTKQW